jgi:hypothetical protein
MAVTMKYAVLCYVMPCCSCKVLRFGGTYRLHHRVENNQRAKNNVSSTFLRKRRFLKSQRRRRHSLFDYCCQLRFIQSKICYGGVNVNY